jgi:hypothetical protein
VKTDFRSFAEWIVVGRRRVSYFYFGAASRCQFHFASFADSLIDGPEFLQIHVSMPRRRRSLEICVFLEMSRHTLITRDLRDICAISIETRIDSLVTNEMPARIHRRVESRRKVHASSGLASTSNVNKRERERERESIVRCRREIAARGFPGGGEASSFEGRAARLFLSAA